MALIFFSCLIALLKVSGIKTRGLKTMDVLFLFLILGGKFFDFLSAYGTVVGNGKFLSFGLFM